MNRTGYSIVAIFGILLMGSLTVHGENIGYSPLLAVGDADDDGVPDSLDLCNGEDASLFDQNGDGCIDTYIGGRHIEYWGAEDLPFTYLIHEDGYPSIGDGSDIAAIVNAFSRWAAVPNTDLGATYGGLTSQADAQALDGIHLVTFQDPDYVFPSAVLAVGITTTFTTPTSFGGRTVRPGQIVDGDIIYNSAKAFRTNTAGVLGGADIEGTGTHEAGHIYGISHSAVETASMFFVLPPGANARTLELDDEAVILKAYPDSATAPALTHISGTVIDGSTLLPVGGAAVFAIDSSGDSAACDYTLGDGSYQFLGLAPDDYKIFVHPLDGSAEIGFLQPGFINSLIDSIAQTFFIPEFYNLGESDSDDPDSADVVTLSAGSPVSGIDIITNVDNDPPGLLSISPADGAADVPIDLAVLLQFDEPIADSSLIGNFSLTNLDSGGTVGGNAYFLNDDQLVAFVPFTSLDYSTNYRVFVGVITDKFGNPLPSPDSSTFLTTAQPPLGLSSLVPNSGPVGSIVIINGAGFDASVGGNSVTFDGVPAVVTAATPSQLTVTVPDSADTGPVEVQSGAMTSGTLEFTVLPPGEIPRGFPFADTQLNALPRAIALTPDATYAYVATQAGVSAVPIVPTEPDYLISTGINFGSDGTVDLAVTPTGKRVYAVNKADETVHVISSDPADGALFNTEIATIPLASPGLGIAIHPNGSLAYIPTSTGEIAILDVNPGSLSLNSLIGTVIATSASLLGPIGTDPAGLNLFVLDGTGLLQVYDIVGGAFAIPATDVVVGPDPRDFAVDPRGNSVFVSLASGNVDVVDIASATAVQTVNTGGSLRGIDVEPSGNTVVTTNRELNELQVINLVPTDPTYLDVAAQVPLGVNPVDVAVAANGFSYSILERDHILSVSAIGSGPALTSLSRTAGPSGTQFVLAGQDFGTDSSVVKVLFNDVEVIPDRVRPTSVTGRVPVGAQTGTVRLRSGPVALSNPLFFEILDPAIPTGEFRFAAQAQPSGAPALRDALEISPNGNILAMGGDNGELFLMDTNPADPDYNQFILSLNLCASAITDIEISADGRRAFVVASGDPALPIVNVNRVDPDFGSTIGMVDFGGLTPAQLSRVEVSPDGEILVAADWDADVIHCIDIRPGSPTEYEVLSTLSVGTIIDLEYHTSGDYLYMTDLDNQLIKVLDTNPDNPTFLTVVSQVSIPFTFAFQSLSFTPDGYTAFGLSMRKGTAVRNIVKLDTSVPDAPAVADVIPYGVGSGTVFERIMVSPKGDRALFHMTGVGFHLLDLTTSPESVIGVTGAAFSTGPVAFEYTPDGRRCYAAGSFTDELLVFDFSGAELIAKSSGDAQTGIVNQSLPLPLEVRVTDNTSLNGIAGVSVAFEVTAGGGGLFGGSTVQNVVTDIDGYAQVDLTLGPLPGANTVQVTAAGLSGSPLDFSATAVDDPSLLPLELLQVVPADGDSAISATTSILATFSRAVDTTSVDSGSFYLQLQGTPAPLPVNIGFTDMNRRISLSPASPLAFNTTYEVVATTGLLDTDGDSLINPQTTSFTTGGPPAVVLNSIFAPSATIGVLLTLSGSGFDPVPANNSVNFTGAQATPSAASADYLQVIVPPGALPGDVDVTVGAQTSNSLPFTVLVPNSTPVNEVLVDSLVTPEPVKGLVIMPDGSRAYTVSPDADVVIPIVITTALVEPPISVGDTPVSIDVNPSGTFVYVPNFNDGTLSIVDVLVGSPTFQQEVQVIAVGAYPRDVDVSPDGTQIYVANSGSNSLSVIDGDPASSTFHNVLATVPTGGKSASSITFTPEGSRVYVGTDDGYIVIDALSYGVLATVPTGGKSASSITFTPEGTLMFFLTTDGEILVFDTEEGSATENQVLATVPTGGKSASSITFTPEGSLLYVILEESDEILVIEVEELGSVSAIDPNALLPPKQIVFTLVQTIQAGEDPYAIAFGPDGTFAVVTNPGELSVTILNTSDVPAGTIQANIEVSPRTLNLDSRGRYVSGLIELPLSYFPEEIDVSTVLLNDTIPAEIDNAEIGDANLNLIKDLTVKFDRALFQQVMPFGEYVPVTITGKVRGRDFIGYDEIRTVRPTLTFPTGGEQLSLGATYTVTWDSPEGYTVESVEVHYTTDDGATWKPIATGIADKGEALWAVPEDEVSDQVRVMVTLFNGGDDIGMGMSNGVSSITLPLSVALETATIGLENQAAVLRWKTSFESGTEGFHVLRSELEVGDYRRVSESMVPARGGTGSDYAFRDDSIRPNRTYFYKIQEMTEKGPGNTFGPYKVEYVASFALEANVPNPFNPTTSIRFTVAEDADVSLIVYDVGGRRIRTLVDGFRRAQNYRVVWDGKDDQGRRVGSGVYFYRFEAGKFSQTRKMIMLK